MNETNTTSTEQTLYATGAAASILQGIGELGTPLTGIYGQFTDMMGEAGDVLDYSTNIAIISTSDNFGRDIAGIAGAVMGGTVGGMSFGVLGSVAGALTLGFDGDVYNAVLGFIAGGAIGTAGGSLVG